jgi:hypothetical protein
MDRIGVMNQNLDRLLDTTAHLRRREISHAEHELPGNRVVNELAAFGAYDDWQRRKMPPPWLGDPILHRDTGTPVASARGKPFGALTAEIPIEAGLDLPARSDDAPGWGRVLDELSWFRAKLIDFHNIGPELLELNRDGGKTYTSMCKALVQQLQENLTALHRAGSVTFVESGLQLRALPHGPVVWIHHIENYLRVLLKDHSARGSLEPKVAHMLERIPCARMIHEPANPDMNTWFDCGSRSGVLPERLKELFDAWEKRAVTDIQAAEMEERLLHDFVYF